MAASMCIRAVRNKRLFSSFLAQNGQFPRNLSDDASQAENAESLYPPIKSRYPPGKWGKMSEKLSWKLHDRGQEFLQIPHVKERLEKFAGDKSIWLQLVTPYDRWPFTLKYKQFITKTHILNGSPGLISDIDTDSESNLARVKDMVNLAAIKEAQYKELPHTSDRDVMDEQLTKRLFYQVFNTLNVCLAPDNPHLLTSQVDNDVRLETFWFCGGFHEDVKCRGRRDGMIQFQYKDKVFYQLRSELPLPQFVDMSDDLCLKGEIPDIDYGPPAIGQIRLFDRPMTMSGHWVGDPCEFGLVSCHVLPQEFAEFKVDVGEAAADDLVIQYGLMSSFASCVAQSFNQGFNPYVDVTYPFTTQTVVTDGQNVRFFFYQLNTLHLWKDYEANPLNNVCWVSDAVPLFETDGPRRFSKEFLQNVIKCLLVKPEERSDLRPYLTEEEAPRNVKVLINEKGQAPLPQNKIGRWQYPRKAAYF